MSVLVDNAIEIVARPNATKASKYREIVAAMISELGRSTAVRTQFTRREIVSLRANVANKHRELRLVTRQLPDGMYVWLERRG